MRDLELLTMASPDFFEPLSRMEIDPIYQRTLDLYVPESWHRKAFDVWLFAQPALDSLIQQGFKIHVSGTRRNAEDLLRLVIPELVARQMPFKVVADPRLLGLMNSKNYDRGSSGKFIVIYPPTIEICKETLDDLYELTRGYEGPYILSDRRYRDSKVLYYRYGGFWPMHRIESNGRRVPCVIAPDGQMEADERLPFFKLPSWVDDPFFKADDEPPPETLLNGRYQVTAAFAFSNGGGVYEATDTVTGATVVLKEARPLSNFWMAQEGGTDYLDAVKVLEREYRAIKKLDDLPFVVKGIEFFREWEHAYLVEERIKGVALTNYRAQDDFIVIALHGKEDRVSRFCEKFAILARQLIRQMLAVHSRRILLVDVSSNNFLIDPETLEVRLIDLETAIDLDAPQIGDEVVRLWTTPGSRRPARNELGEYLPEDDYYALGMVLYSLLIPFQTFFEMETDAVELFIDDLSAGLGLPPQIKQTIFLLLSGEATHALDVIEGWDVGQFSATRRTSVAPPRPWEIWLESDRSRISESIRQVLPRIGKFLLATADPSREDRLWPADFRVFDTNPLNVACGACGPLLFLKAIGQEAPPEIRSWVDRLPFREDAYPPGLYWGLAGIACSLEELGFPAKAAEALSRAVESPLRFSAADMWFGAAGWGWANLWFHARTGESQLLERAREAGRHLASSAETTETGCCWRNPLDGNVHYGFAYGASGICLFLAQLFKATGDEEYRELARRGLAFELHSALDPTNVIKWFNHEKARGICEPYFEHGSAGIGAAFLRCAELLDDRQYLETAEQAAEYAFCKWTVVPTQFSGLSGIGEFMLDLFLATGRDLYLNQAYAVAETILKFAVNKRNGVAFPGRLLIRLSNDFGTGSAGIGLFLQRLLEPGPRRFVDAL